MTLKNLEAAAPKVVLATTTSTCCAHHARDALVLWLQLSMLGNASNMTEFGCMSHARQYVLAHRDIGAPAHRDIYAYCEPLAITAARNITPSPARGSSVNII